MPMVIPVIASFAAAGSAIAAAGGVMAAMSTLGGFLAVAGAALTGIGALTGKKDLVKVGSLMTLGSSLAGAASSASSTAATEAAAKEAASSATSDSFGTAFDADAAAAAESSATPTTAGMEQATQGAAKAGADGIDPLERANNASQGNGSSIFDRATEASNGSPAMSTAGPATPEGSSILERLSATGQDGSSLANVNGQALQPGVSPSASMPQGVTINGEVMSTDPIAQYARNTPASQIQAANNASAAKSASMLDSVGSWMRNNKELASLGGQLVTGLAQGYGQQQQFDAQQSIYERRRRNLNNPVALTFGVR